MLKNKTIIFFAIITFFISLLFSFGGVFAQSKKLFKKQHDFKVPLQQPSPGNGLLEKIPKGWDKNGCIIAINEYINMYDMIARKHKEDYATNTVGSFSEAITLTNQAAALIAEEGHRIRSFGLAAEDADGMYHGIVESFPKFRSAHQKLQLLERDLEWIDPFIAPHGNLRRAYEEKIRISHNVINYCSRSKSPR
jgi:hypothetical protein